MGKINKVWVVSLLTVLAVAVFGIVAHSAVVINNVVEMSSEEDDGWELLGYLTISCNGSHSYFGPLEEAGEYKVEAWSGAINHHCKGTPPYDYWTWNSSATNNDYVVVNGNRWPGRGCFATQSEAEAFWKGSHIILNLGEGSYIDGYFQDPDYRDNEGSCTVAIYVRSGIDYIKVFPDSADVCVNESQQFITKGYGYGENGKRDGDPDPETYAPAGDDTGPESIEVAWTTSVAEEVGTIGASGLFTAGDTHDSGTVTATYEREGEDPLTDSAGITVVGVRITGRDFVLCPAPWPGRMPENATQTTLEAKGTPSGGEYSWSIISGSDKVELKGENSKAVVKGINPSGSEKDVELKVVYTLHDCSCSTTYKLTVKRPKSAPIVREYPPQENGQFYWRKFIHELRDQFGDTIETAGIPVGERATRTDGFWFAQVGWGDTSSEGTFSDTLKSWKRIPHSEWYQKIRAGCIVILRRFPVGGWDVGHFNITFDYPDVTKKPAP